MGHCGSSPPGLAVDRFLQQELLQGQIVYQHSGDEQFEDAFDFTLSDSQQPPNLSQTYVGDCLVSIATDRLRHQ